MKKIFLLLLSAANMMAASAFRIEYGNDITISKAVYEDLYIAGNNIIINAPVHGDLIIAGGTIIINDSVMNDIILAGGNVTFNGYVADDIRCAGGKIYIHKNVAGDVVVTGGSVILHKGISVGGLITSGGTVIADGDVNGEVKAAAGDLFIKGNVAKNIDCRGGRITVDGIINGSSILAADNIIIGNNAVFNNDVRYWNKQGKLDFNQSLKNSRATYDASLKPKTSRWYFLGATSILGVLWYLGMALLMIFITQYLFAAVMKKAADRAFENTLKSFGLGLLFFIGVPVAAIIAFITMIGVPVGVLLVFGYILSLLMATIITAVVGANWFNNRNNHNWNYRQLVFASFGIFILLKLVNTIPFFGWFIMCLLVCVSFGSIIQNIKWRKQTAAD